MVPLVKSGPQGYSPGGSGLQPGLDHSIAGRTVPDSCQYRTTTERSSVAILPASFFDERVDLVGVQLDTGPCRNPFEDLRHFGSADRFVDEISQILGRR